MVALALCIYFGAEMILSLQRRLPDDGVMHSVMLVTSLILSTDLKIL